MGGMGCLRLGEWGCSNVYQKLFDAWQIVYVYNVMSGHRLDGA